MPRQADVTCQQPGWLSAEPFPAGPAVGRSSTQPSLLWGGSCCLQTRTGIPGCLGAPACPSGQRGVGRVVIPHTSAPQPCWVELSCKTLSVQCFPFNSTILKGLRKMNQLLRCTANNSTINSHCSSSAHETVSSSVF